MPQYDYTKILAGPRGLWEENLQGFGNKGWEMCGVQHGRGDEAWIYFKREKPAPAGPTTRPQ